MIIVISDTEIFEGEAAVVNSLFDEGLQVFHLRKYNNSKGEVVEFVSRIKPEYRDRIALHQFHEVADQFGIKRLHFSEKDRERTSEDEWRTWKEKETILSTSIHSIDAYNKLSVCFDYAFLSPVFDSISKNGYTAQVYNFNLRQHTDIALIALGGVKEENCIRAFEMGFDGMALLGSIWKSEKPVDSFKSIYNKLMQANR